MSTILCMHCNTPSRPEDRFCKGCGKAMPIEEKGPTLVVRWPSGETNEHTLTKQIIHIGRGQDNDIVLDSPTVSRRHLKLEVTASGISVTDMNSTNGTQLDGQQIQSKVQLPWLPGETIRVGDLRGNSVSMDIKRDVGEASPTHHPGMQKLSQFSHILIGRDPASQLHLNDPAISRRHAEIVRQDAGYAIRDLGSANGTFVNGQRVSGWVPLCMNDVVHVGPLKFTYDMETQSLSRPVSKGHDLDAIKPGMKMADNRMILKENEEKFCPLPETRVEVEKQDEDKGPLIEDLEEEQTEDEYVFRRDRDVWHITYEGKRFPALKPEIGLTYIAFLLYNPGIEIKAYHLSQMENKGIPPEKWSSYRTMNEEELKKSGLSIYKGKNVYRRKSKGYIDDVVDELTDGELKERLGVLEELKNDPETFNTTRKILIYQDEIDKIKNVRSDKKREYRNALYTVEADSVKKAINQSLEKIKEVNGPLYKHLDTCIERGPNCIYDPIKVDLTVYWSP